MPATTSGDRLDSPSRGPRHRCFIGWPIHGITPSCTAIKVTANSNSFGTVSGGGDIRISVDERIRSDAARSRLSYFCASAEVPPTTIDSSMVKTFRFEQRLRSCSVNYVSFETTNPDLDLRSSSSLCPVSVPALLVPPKVPTAVPGFLIHTTLPTYQLNIC